VVCSGCGSALSPTLPVCAVCNAGFVVKAMGQAAPAAALSVAPVAAVAAGPSDAFPIPDVLVGDPAERRVRPTLAVLYRLAVGPAADYYTPRFLEFERTGHMEPGWHWAAMLVPPVWAFYRKLWVTGIVYATMPLLGALAVRALGERIDDWNMPFLIVAALLIWLLPSLCAATMAHSLLYRRIRRLVRRAEATSVNAADAARVITERDPTSGVAGMLLGVGAIAMALGLAAPDMLRAYTEYTVREQVSQTLAAVKDVQQKVEERFERTGRPPQQRDELPPSPALWAHMLDELSLNPATGRLRLSLGPAVPQLWGKTLLLAPALDVFQRVRWYCIPIDIPAKYLPKECR
jgi:hypothetical protein